MTCLSARVLRIFFGIVVNRDPLLKRIHSDQCGEMKNTFRISVLVPIPFAQDQHDCPCGIRFLSLERLGFDIILLDDERVDGNRTLDLLRIGKDGVRTLSSSSLNRMMAFSTVGLFKIFQRENLGEESLFHLGTLPAK